MGQPIQVEATQLGDVVIFDTDRSITGQDGATYASQDEAAASDEFPAQLAARIFASGLGANHVFVASNQVVVRRKGAWTGDEIDTASRIVSDFFLYYPDAQ